MANLHTPDPMSTTVTAAEEATPHESESAAVAPPAYAPELAALRARLREVEVALGLPLRPGQPAPPDLPALRRRVAALERRAGVVPGLVPLPGCDEAAAPARATTITAEPAGRGTAWRERGRAALAAVAAVAALAWLLHPLPGGPGASPPPAATARPAAALAATPAAIPAAAPAPADRVSPPHEADPVGPAAAPERAPTAWPGYHCGAAPPPVGQVCDNESSRLAPQAPPPAPADRASPPHEADGVGPGAFAPRDAGPASGDALLSREGSRNQGPR
ncbi:MAG TPA: hypothetical protein VFL91_16865 [Thermomicrobiales bacterium]|nr:hypothetical protein [Thermomicrobiales bacterium]